MTWTCHVCGDERPDEKISVYTKAGRIGAVEFSQNIRYCNDRIECESGAITVDFLGGDDGIRATTQAVIRDIADSLDDAEVEHARLFDNIAEARLEHMRAAWYMRRARTYKNAMWLFALAMAAGIGSMIGAPLTTACWTLAVSGLALTGINFAWDRLKIGFPK